MSARDRATKPPRGPAGRPQDPDQQLPVAGGPRLKSEPGPVPDQWATHRLVSIAARLYERRLNRRLARLGLTTGSLDALDAAASLEPATASDLADMLCVSRQSLGKVLRRLQKLGFLTREPGRDGRSADVRLTRAGREVLSAAEELVRNGPEAAATDEALFRRQLEQHIGYLRNAEQSTLTRHADAVRQARPARGSGHRQNPVKTHFNEAGASIWRQQTGLPAPKPPSKEQPRQ
ncbi:MULTISPECIES: MarR family transcriptional regulator [Micrococcaceae]|uniref:MarR family transcriptional regulator n=1 Tax=Micrococcaceae TaxID=1268 RepID=UPI0035945765